MWEIILLFILGLIIGILVGATLKLIPYLKEKGAKKREQNERDEMASPEGRQRLIREGMKEKQVHLDAVIAYFRTHDAVKNDDIENLLGVSDATATRYLEALERQGAVRQVGKVGRNVHYEPINLPEPKKDTLHDES